MKTIRTASFNKLSKKKEWDPNPWAVCTDSVGREDKDKYERCVQKVKQKQNTKPAKMPKNYRTQWNSDDDFSDKLRDEFSGNSEKKKDDALNDKWEQLTSKKRQPAFASKKDKKKKEPEMVKPFKR